jgi:serine protease Do
MQDVDEGVAAALGIDRNSGTLIRSVTPDGPAARGGVQQGDVVVSVAGRPVTPDATLAYLISQQPIGSRVPLEVIRQGQRRTVNIAIAERPPEEELARLNGVEDENATTGGEAGAKPGAEAQSPGQRSAQQSLGLALRPLTPALAQQLQIRDANVRGVVVGNVDPNSDAGQKGVQTGDVILSINQQPTASPEAAAAIIDAARRAGRTTVLLLVRRANSPPLYVGVELARAAAAAR